MVSIEGEDVAGVGSESACSAECANTLRLMRQRRKVVHFMGVMIIVGSSNNGACKEDNDGRDQII